MGIVLTHSDTAEPALLHTWVVNYTRARDLVARHHGRYNQSGNLGTVLPWKLMAVQIHSCHLKTNAKEKSDLCWISVWIVSGMKWHHRATVYVEIWIQESKYYRTNVIRIKAHFQLIIRRTCLTYKFIWQNPSFFVLPQLPGICTMLLTQH